jgi:hypothetical protein
MIVDNNVHSRLASVAKWAIAAALMAQPAALGAENSNPCLVVKAPMVCSRSPGTQYFEARISAPATAATDSVYTVRIDSFSSGRISNIGLNYVHQMLTDYLLPAGVSYVAKSARIVPDTGTENVRTGASAWSEGSLIRMYLPAQVDRGSLYTPPSLEFQVRVTANSGASLPLQFLEHRTTVNVFLFGDLQVVCTPSPSPLTIATTRVVAPVP